MNDSIYPLNFPAHITFCIIALVYFLIQYIRTGYKYQLFMAVTVPSSLLVYVIKSQTMFYGLGIFEFAMLVLVFVTMALEKKTEKRPEAASEPDGLQDNINQIEGAED